MPEIRRWMSAWDLVERWNIEGRDLVDMIIHGELTAYYSRTLQPVDATRELEYMTDQPASERGYVPTIIEEVYDFVFKIDEVIAFEEKRGLGSEEKRDKAKGDGRDKKTAAANQKKAELRKERTERARKRASVMCQEAKEERKKIKKSEFEKDLRALGFRGHAVDEAWEIIVKEELDYRGRPPTNKS